MKSKLIIPILLVLTILFAGMVSAAQEVSITLLNQDPDPAIAGDVVEVKLAIENDGSTAMEDMVIEIEPSYPFMAIYGEPLVEEIGTLNPYQNSGDMKIVSFNLIVDPNAVAGDHNIDVIYYEESGSYTVQKTLTLEVVSEDSAEIIYINQIELIPGKKTELQFTINNVGSAHLTDLTFSWSNEDEVILSVGSDNTKYIQSLDVGESKILGYNVMADSSADAGLYKLDLSLIYNDPITNEQNIVNTIAGIYVGGETDFEIAYSDNSDGEMAFTIANIGSNDATSVSIKVQDQQGVSIIGASSNIIGNLNKGDYTVATFEIQTNVEEIDLGISYTDTTGERVSITKSVSTGSSSNNLVGEDSEDTKMSSGRGSGGMGAMTSGVNNLIPIIKWSVIIIVVLVVGLIGFKIYKKKHKGKVLQK